MRRIVLATTLSGAFATAAAQPATEHVRGLPAPSGPNAVGTVVAYLVDRRQPDQELPDGRPITVQFWYPTVRATSPTAPYLVEAGLGAALRRIEYADTSALAAWDTLRTHAMTDVPPLPGRHPLVTFSVGLGVIRANYTAIATELASEGYIVALIESPFAGFMVRPGGLVISDTTQRLESADGHRRAVGLWARDVSFVLDEMMRGKTSGTFRQVAGTVDWSRVGALGHSSGGLVAMATCQGDPRVRACLNMDGGLASPEQEPIADVTTTGVSKPTLFLRSQPLYGEADFARRGITREQWEKRGEPGRIAFAEFAKRSRGPLWTASVAGTGHSSFSDMPFVMPSAITRFGGKIIDADRGHLIITDVIRTFFEHQLRRRPSTNVDLGIDIPEVTITRAKS